MTVLSRSLKLLIDDFGKKASLSRCIREYDGMLVDYMRKLGTTGVVHFGETYIPFM